MTGIFETIKSMGHEQVLYCSEPTAGLTAIIAVHSTRLGPALGATRLWPYATEEAALRDVLRLSRGMTLKAACAGLAVGGGKGVIIASPHQKSPMMLRAYGRFVERLAGRFVTGTDVNTTEADMVLVRRETQHVLNRPQGQGGAGDTGPITALGVSLGMSSAVEMLLRRGLRGTRVAIQGLGKVGQNLCRILAEAGAKLSVCDADPAVADRIARRYRADLVPPDAIYDLEVDVFAPCALGGILNQTTIPRLRCRIVAGGANNQLEDEAADARRLEERGIVYCPDFVLNSGGLISVAQELNGMDRPSGDTRVFAIRHTMATILRSAHEARLSPLEAALVLADQRLHGTSALAA